jgi:molecular chaperone GrpE (heat shock protein)
MISSGEFALMKKTSKHGNHIKLTIENDSVSKAGSAGKKADTEPNSIKAPDLESAPASRTGMLASIILKMESRIDNIAVQLAQIQNEFKEQQQHVRIKDEIIDNLYKDLQEFKNETVKKHYQSTIMDIIKIIDDIRRLTNYYHSEKPSESDPAKLLKHLEGIPSDLEDLLYWQEVKPFTCSGQKFDPRRQRVLKKIETPEKSKDKTVAESLLPGYEWEGRIIRPEMVTVYLYTAMHIENEINISNE